MRGEIDVPSLRTQEVEVAARRLAARHDDEVGVAWDRLPGAEHRQRHVRLLRQWVQIVEIGDARQGQADDPKRAGRQARGAGPGHPRPAGARPPGTTAALRSPAIRSVGDQPVAFVKKARVTTKPVDDKSFYKILRRCFREPRWVPTIWAITPPRSMSPARITGTPAAAANPMLAMSPSAQVDLGGTACALDDDEVVGAVKPSEALQHHRQKTCLQAAVFARLYGRQAAALDDHLRAGVGLGLEQDRVHVGHGRQAGRPWPAAPAPGRSRRRRWSRQRCSTCSAA